MISPRSLLPRSTYRLQMLGHLRFEDARGLADYLSELGIGALYLSPIFRACRGSTHGYDIVDPRQLDPQLGTEDDFRGFAESVREQGMGIMLDLVPNHMGIDDPHNVWWRDVLENGPASQYASFFDIDWSPPKAALHDRILLAVLGDQFGKVLEEQQLQLLYEDQTFQIRFYQRRYPTDHRTWVPILRRVLEHLPSDLPADHPQRMELESVVTALDHLPPRTELGPDKVQERYREKEIARRRLGALVSTSTPVQEALAATLQEYDGRRGDPQSFTPLENFLDEQAYRLCYWRVATDEINYRRFFDVDSMAAIRVEDPRVFETVHEAVLRFIEQGWVTALRVDHADGLLDPRSYLETLREKGAAALTAAGPAAGAAPAGFSPPYIVVEKILGPNESLPERWPVEGTTGYDFLNLLNSVFVDRRGAAALRTNYLRFTDQTARFADVLFDSKRTILGSSLSSELYVLSNQLVRIAEQHRWSRDFTRPSLYRALRDVVAGFQVYRTYIRPGDDQVRDEDRRRIREAVRFARRRNPAMSPSFFEFIESVLLLKDPEGLTEDDRKVRRDFVLKMQQVTGPIAAKGMEDTAFYRFYPLLSLNEVGGDPAQPPATPEQFHRRISDRAALFPHDMSATGTHDTKRGEDLRARLNVLSETPDGWATAVGHWRDLNAALHKADDDVVIPDSNEEYLIYQTMVGTWPVESLDDEGWKTYTDRLVQYFEKALHEAKLHTSWLSPDQEYDEAVANFVRSLLANRESDFVKDLDRFARSIADAGFVNSLAQTLLKICVPGVPDFYQGSEFWDFALVDPDNRRPVDFQRRRETLAALRAANEQDHGKLVRELLTHWPDERVKMFVIWRALQMRKEHSDLFEGGYQPLAIAGNGDAKVLAFARTAGANWLLCIVPRLGLPAWQMETTADVALPWPPGSWWRKTQVQLPPAAPRTWRHVLTDQSVAAAVSGDGTAIDAGELFEQFPVALLISEAATPKQG